MKSNDYLTEALGELRGEPELSFSSGERCAQVLLAWKQIAVILMTLDRRRRNFTELNEESLSAADTATLTGEIPVSAMPSLDSVRPLSNGLKRVLCKDRGESQEDGCPRILRSP